MSLEESFISFGKMYQSRKIQYDTKLKRIPIHERFAIQTNHQMTFIKTKLQINGFETTIQTDSIYTLMYNMKDSEKELVFEIKPDFSISIIFRFLTGRNDNNCNTNTDSDVFNKLDESPSLIELIKITKDFMKKVTFVRKLQWNVEKELFRKSGRRDFVLLFLIWLYSCLYHLFLPTLLLLFCFQTIRDKSRVYLVETISYYFKVEDPDVELNNNLVWIKGSQLMIINFTNFMKELSVFGSNKRVLYKLFKYFLPILFLFYVLHFFTIKDC